MNRKYLLFRLLQLKLSYQDEGNLYIDFDLTIKK